MSNIIKAIANNNTGHNYALTMCLLYHLRIADISFTNKSSRALQIEFTEIRL
jgi:hypothetical protein